MEPKLSATILVDLLNKRSVEGFKILYSKYFGQLIFYSTSILGSREDAEDVIQDVFLELWQGRSHFEAEPQLVSYLYKAVKHRSISLERRRKRFIFNITFLKEHESGDSPYNNFDLNRELRALFSTSLGELPRECKKIFYLMLKGLSSVEIALKEGRAASTVRTQKKRGIDAIRKLCISNRVYKELFNGYACGSKL